MSTELFKRNHVTSAAIQDALLQTDFPDLELYASGKVRDVYRVDNDHLLFVATDRISAFDYVLGSGIPNKGKVLTQISLFWFDFLKDVVPNHVVTANVDEYPEPLRKYSDQLRGRSMLVVHANMCPVECVVRGYLSGSGWKEYQSTGTVCGIDLPKGLRESDRLPQPIFTPATKATTGHDENISFHEMKKLAGPELSEKLLNLSLKVYEKASAHAAKCGILIADTKFEFGTTEAGVVLADEVLTPDSSRFWPADKYSPGSAQFSYDKQFVRNYLEQIKWDKRPPAPALPPDVVAKTSEKYVEAFRLLTGRELET
jgi:phosphoribosylaminoimidazole-succinocarboxamide synthase